ncbi:MAG: Asp-tRNA(Asn)/Glu-tRNA(Gln) amidotransferase subunit GatC [Candidatus Dependentiae bacterium]|nr:Asp-tRNA(Asn)/Glu-tRNA(Gln) amidotransferase subunit GatC [Candidatus Dependentiae bacterium]
MPHITESEILHLANLARIKLEPHEVTTLVGEIEATLAYASSLKDISQRYVPTDLPVDCSQNVLRDDEIVRFDAEEILAQAPEREDNYFVVPRILKRG